MANPNLYDSQIKLSYSPEAGLLRVVGIMPPLSDAELSLLPLGRDDFIPLVNPNIVTDVEGNEYTRLEYHGEGGFDATNRDIGTIAQFLAEAMRELPGRNVRPLDLNIYEVSDGEHSPFAPGTDEVWALSARTIR